jgi:beta-alanine degradation protein BauB
MRDVDIEVGTGGWLAAQEHYGENIGDTATHVIFGELKEPATFNDPGQLGPLSH